MTSTPRPHVQSVEDTATFEGLRQEWTALLAASATDRLFLTWEWLFTWWKHLAGGRRPSILTVRAGGELVAIAPLIVGARGWRSLWCVRSVEFLGTGSVGSDYLDVVARKGHEAAVAEALAEHLSHAGRTLQLRQARSDAWVATALAPRLRRRGWTAELTTSDVCPFIRLAGRTWPAYLAALDPGHRRDVQYALRRLGREFDVRLELARSEPERRESLALLVALHQRRWGGRGGSTAFHTPALLAFHDEVSRRALERGWLRLYLLRLDGRPAAALYCFRYGPAFAFYQGGFDPAYARYSVGTVLVALSIEQAIAEGAEEYDLLHGGEPYKFHWARETRELGRLELYPPGVRARIDRCAVEAGRAAARTARRALARPAGLQTRRSP